MKGPTAGKGTTVVAGLGTAGSAGWATFAGGPVWVPIFLASITVVLGIVQAVLRTARDVVPQESKDRLAATGMVLTYLTARRRGRIKERRERAHRKALAPARRSRTTVLVAEVIARQSPRPAAAAPAARPHRRAGRRPLTDDRQAPGRSTAG